MHIIVNSKHVQMLLNMKNIKTSALLENVKKAMKFAKHCQEENKYL